MDTKNFRIGGPGPKDQGNRFKNAGFIILLIIFGLILYAAFNKPDNLQSVPFSQAITQANAGQTQQITVNGDELTITPKGQSSPTEKSYKEPGSSIYQQGLQQGKVELIN